MHVTTIGGTTVHHKTGTMETQSSFGLRPWKREMQQLSFSPADYCLASANWWWEEVPGNPMSQIRRMHLPSEGPQPSLVFE